MSPYNPEKVVALREFRTPDDVVMALFTFFEKPLFTTDLQAIHTVFCELSKKPEYQPFLGDLRFVERPHFPHSSQLEQAFYNLEITGKLEWTGPLRPRYIVQPRVLEVIRTDVLSRFSEEEQTVLRSLAQELEERLATFERPPIS